MGIPDLVIVIPSWNTCDLLRNCLASVYADQDVDLQVCVVDDASSDGSPEMVEREFPQARLTRSKAKGGFAYNTNLGLRTWGFCDDPIPGSASRVQLSSLPRYALLLNSDTVTPPGGLDKMVSFMDAHPDVGAVGPKLVRLDGSLDLACRRSFPTPEISFYHVAGLGKRFPHSRRFGRYNLTYLDPDQPAEVDSVVGAFMLVRAQAIVQVGLLDETFYFGGEDLDWAYRIKQAGWKIYYNPAVTVQHVKRASFQKSAKAQYEFERALWLFYHKHYQPTTPFVLNALICFGLALRGGIPLAREILNSNGKTASTKGDL